GLRLGGAEVFERPGFPVLGRHPGLALAVAGETREDPGRLGVVPAEVADPAGAPACFLGRAGGRIALGEGRVGGVGVVVGADFLLDAAHGVERLRGLAAAGEPACQVAEELERGSVVVGVPAPVGRLAEGASAVQSELAVVECKADGLRRFLVPEGTLGAGLDPELMNPRLAAGDGCEHDERLALRSLGITLRQAEVGLVETLLGARLLACTPPD